MRYLLRIGLFFGLIISPLQSHAQALTTRDNEEVKLLARRKVELGLNDLLNVLSLTDLGEAERNALISESFSAGANQLFADKDDIIEDDINPNRAAAGTVLDMPVEKYLANFDLLYAKSAQSTVRFTDVSVSNLKRASNLYVKVAFTSVFGGKNTKIDKPYGPVRRVAEVRAEQVGAKWTVAITRIAFALPADSANAALNNVPLVEAAPRRLPAPTDPVAMRGDFVQAAAVATPPADPEKEREKAALATYQKLLANGKIAFDNNDLETAQRLYEQAEKQQPFEDLTPRVRLFRIQKVLEERSRNLLAEQKKRLALALRKRHYAEALSLLQRITDQQPDSTGLDEQRKDLITKARRKAELDERFAAGQYRDLVKEYGRLIDGERKQTKQTGIQTNASDWFLGRGKSQTQLGDYKDALRDLNESLTLDFQNLDALESRADLYARLGDYPKAAADLSVYLTVDPTNADLLARRASYRLRTNRPAEAFADYDEAIRISQNPRFYLLRGLLHQQSGACDKAETDFSEGINRSRRQPELYFRRGMAQVCLKDYAAAGTDFTRATELGLDRPNRSRIDSIAATFYAQSEQDRQARKTPDALGQLAIALQLQPDYADAWLAKGKLHNAQSQYPQADSALTNAIRHNPTNAAGFYERGLTNLNTSQFGPATTDFRQAIALQPALHEATLGEARALMGQRQYDQAQTALNQLFNERKQLEKKYPPTFFADVFFLAGRCAYELKHYNAALNHFEEVLSFAKNWAAAYTERGRTYEAIGKPDRARDDYNRAAQLEPTVAAHHLPIALLLFNRDKIDEALREYTRCQELDSDHRLTSATALGKGRCYMATGQYLDALNELNQVGKYDGLACTDECLYLRTYAQIRTGQLPTSTRLGGALTKATSPGYAPKLRYALACAHLQANDDAQALVQLEKALQMGVAREFLKKDLLLDFVRKNFRKTPAYGELVSRYR